MCLSSRYPAPSWACTRTTPAPTEHLLPPQQTQSQAQTKALDENISWHQSWGITQWQWKPERLSLFLYVQNTMHTHQSQNQPRIGWKSPKLHFQKVILLIFNFFNSEAIMTYHSTIPSPTALNRSSVFGFIGITCRQSGSFSRALFIQFTKAYFSSSKITNHKFNTGFS